MPEPVHENAQAAPIGHVTLQSTQAPPVAPQLVVDVPSSHIVPVQQPPLQGEVSLQLFEHAPPLQALPGEQSVSVAQPQVPPAMQAEPFLPAQLEHVPPGGPQEPDAVPGWQVAPLQHPPLQGDEPLQLVEHVPPLQALMGEQSVSVVHPQVPPPRQAEPFFPAQSTHAAAEPQAVCAVPDMQVPVEPPQQNPAPQPPPSQSAEHEPLTHVGVAPVHATHALPAEPHSGAELPLTHVVPSQHPPLHVRPPAQLVEHVPLVGSHASPFGQLGVVHDG